MAKLIDLTGQRFDKVVVLQQAPSRARHVYWKCKCDCGNECQISGDSLRKPLRHHDCGCVKRQQKQIKLQQEKERQRKIQEKQNWLINQRFGKLFVLEKTEERISNSVVWKCQCDCGNIKYVPTHLLTSGDTQSCGCLIREAHWKDITNQKFGKLTALYPLPRTEKGALIWHCICDCGTECDINGSNLRRKLTQSCGCLSGSVGEQNIKNILQQNNIKFKREFTFSDLRNSKTNKAYRFDFAIFNDDLTLKRLIEFDGQQHTLSKRGRNWMDKESLEERQFRDTEKNQYCKNHNIPLVRIPYTERNDITLDMLLGDQYLI